MLHANDNNQLTWLLKKREQMLDMINNQIEEVEDHVQRDALTKIVELVNIDSSIQTQCIINMLTDIKKNEMEIDRELMEVSEYLSTIVNIHLSEAENLEKVL